MCKIIGKIHKILFKEIFLNKLFLDQFVKKKTNLKNQSFCKKLYLIAIL